MRPRWQSFRKGRFDSHRRIKTVLLSIVGLAFWTGIFGISLRVLTYFQQIEELGNILARKLLLMVLVTFLGLMIFSAILSILSKLYLSRDLDLVHSLPAPRSQIFTARWIESTVDSSWMVIVYTLPVLIAYGVVYRTGAFFYLDILLSLVPLAFISSALSALLVLAAVVVLPANRVRSIFFFLGLAALVIVYISFRVLRPERLADPEAFNSVLAYLQTLDAPASPWLPSTWSFDSLTAALRGEATEALFHSALCWSGAAFVTFIAIGTAHLLYFRGYSKTQTAPGRLIASSGKPRGRFGRHIPGPIRAFTTKELRSFWRDQSQWSQVFLMAALVVIYLYNFSVLPLERSPIDTVFLQNLVSFLNMGLASFVIIAVTARFAYPSVSTEAGAFWIVLSSPISLSTFLWIKFLIYLLPLILLSELLIVATNLLLHVSSFMMILSSATIFFLTPGVVALGIGLGAAYPDFASENPAQTVTSFGGLVFMMISAAYIGVVIILEAGPVHNYLMTNLRGDPISLTLKIWFAVSFSAAFVLSILAVFLPLQFGARRLKARY
jgi:ABC-2 type transport system permease protein